MDLFYQTLRNVQEGREQMKRLSELKKGEYFTTREIAEPNENQVFVKGDYDRSTKTYSCYKFGDVNEERFFKGTQKIFVEFVF